METDRDPVGIPLPEVSQIAFVVEDLEGSMRRFGRLLGVEQWLLYDYEPPRLTNTTYRGEPHEYSMRVAITDVEGPIDLSTKLVPAGVLKRVLAGADLIRDWLGFEPRRRDSSTHDGKVSPNPGLPGVNIELIEPLRGPSIYTEHLDENGDGIHHIGCFAYDDPAGVVEMYENAGISVVQSGYFEGVEFWYLDLTRELNGMILEVAADLWRIPEPDGVFPE